MNFKMIKKMNIQETKLELIKKLLDTSEEAVLAEVWKVLEESAKKDRILSEKEYELIDNRRERHLSGERSSFSWAEVKQQARQAADE